MHCIERTCWPRACGFAATAALLVASAAAGAAEILDSRLLEKYVDLLPNPLNNLYAPVGTDDGLPLYEVTISQFTQQLHRDLPPTTLWGYGGSFPGPTFDVDRGEHIQVRWVNNLVDAAGAPLEQHLLPYDTTLHGAHDHLPRARVVAHVHGGITDEMSDGYPEHWFTPDPNAPPNGLGGPAGNALVTNHPNNQRSATLWYHDHTMAITRLNVYAGMAGLFLIRDAEEASLNLPSGEYEVPLVLQDRAFYDDGQLYYPNGLDHVVLPGGTPIHGGHDHTIDADGFPSEASVVPHFFGNANLVNGVVWPLMEVEPRKYRFRLLNGANSRTYDLLLGDGNGGQLAFHQIGASGGLLASVAEREQVLLAGGDRADVIVDFSDFSPGDEIYLRNVGPDDEYRFFNTPADPETTGQVMKFKVVELTAPDTSSLPTELPEIERYDPADAVRTRNLRLTQTVDAYGRTELLLDGKAWSDPVSDVIQLGELEIWELENRTPMAHPIHLHADHFQVLDRVRRSTGQQLPLGPEELGWVDTVLVGAGETVRIMVKFEQFTGTFVWHCHMLEHEDSEMMRPFTIVPEPASWGLVAVAVLFWIPRWRRGRTASRC